MANSEVASDYDRGEAALDQSEPASCWTCGLRQKGTVNLLGTCWGWLDKWGGQPREIPGPGNGGGYRADEGCGRWTDKPQDFEALAKAQQAPQSAQEPASAGLDKAAPQAEERKPAARYQADLFY